MKLLRLALLCLIGASLLTGCNGPADDAKAAVDQPIAYAIDQRIGDDLQDVNASFARIDGLARAADGRLYVADAQAHEIKVFDPSGDFLFVIGRQGAGPGELANPCCVAFDPVGRLWVRDGGNARYSVYTAGDTVATFVTQVRFAHGDFNRFVPITFESAGNVIDIGSRAGASVTPQTHRYTLGPDGKVTRDLTVPEVPAESTAMKMVQREITGGRATFYLYPPYGPTQLVAHAVNGEWAHALSARYAIDWRAADGTLIRHLTRDIERGPELSPAERQRAEEGLLQDRKRVGTDPGFSVPSHKQPLRRLFFDTDGRLWVELSVSEGAARRAHIYDRNGQRAGQADWPAEVDLRYGLLRGDTAWGFATDSLGVQTVVRLVAR